MTTIGADVHLPPLSRRILVIYALLFVAALAPRLAAAYLVPSVDWDAYEYTEKAQLWREALAQGRIPLKLLYGFWLPLFSLTSGAVQVLWNEPYHVPKLISALCGALGCVLTYTITRRLTQNAIAAAAAFVIMAAGPYHILYSASAMTEAPNALLVSGSLALGLGRRWLGAAVLGVLACLLRYDAWVLVLLIPLLAWCDGKRREAAIALVLLSSAVASWFVICKLATGNALAQMNLRDKYLTMYNDFHAEATARTLENLATNFGRLTLIAGVHFLVASFVVAIASFARRKRALRREVWIGAGFLYGYAASLAFAYLSGSQPVLWVRYGLILAVLGVPFFFWAITELGHLWPRANFALSPVYGMAFLAGGAHQLVCVSYDVRGVVPQTQVAAFLAEEAQRNPSLKVFCDEPMVRVLSRLGRDRFVRSQNARAQKLPLLDFLRETQVTHVVYSHVETSLLTQELPHLRQSGGQVSGQSTASVSGFAPVHEAQDLLVYKFK